jgi:ferritin-like metal-binding protein YciE
MARRSARAVARSRLSQDEKQPRAEGGRAKRVVIGQKPWQNDRLPARRLQSTFFDDGNDSPPRPMAPLETAQRARGVDRRIGRARRASHPQPWMVINSDVRLEAVMAPFSSLTLHTLEDLLLAQIEDLYDAEQRFAKALPNLAEAATSLELKSAFQDHLRETEQHVARLKEVFDLFGVSPSRLACKGMKGLISEGDEVIAAEGEPEVKDAALIAAAQRVEHYQIAGYGSARTFAHELGHYDIARILQKTLAEESATDKLLTEIAQSAVNPAATRS